MKALSLCLLLFVAAPIGASDRDKSSGIEGTVTLNTTIHLAGVTIGVDSLARGTHIQSETNESGNYLFDDVRPGAYSMWAEAKGYGCILIPRVAVHYSERVRQDFNFVRGKSYESCEGVEKKKR